jgi:hypothetical protein
MNKLEVTEEELARLRQIEAAALVVVRRSQWWGNDFIEQMQLLDKVLHEGGRN